MGWGWGVAGDLKREINKKRKEKQPLDLSKFKNLTNEREKKTRGQNSCHRHKVQ
jgi:hypothetical protein